MQQRSGHTSSDAWPDETTHQQPSCSEKMHVVLGHGVGDESMGCAAMQADGVQGQPMA